MTAGFLNQYHLIPVKVLWYYGIYILYLSERGNHMKMTRILIQVPAPMKHKLDALRDQGYSVAGDVRAVLERELNKDIAESKVR